MKNKRGFTLIELILVIAIIGIVVSILYSPISLSNSTFKKQNEKAKAISDLRAAMDYLTREIRKADRAEVDGDLLIIGSKTYKLENGGLLKDDKKVLQGIDKWDNDINIEEGTIRIKIMAEDTSGGDHELSSIIYIR